MTNEQKIISDCIDTFGEERQIDKAIEETTEYLLELIRIKNGLTTPRKLAGEMADLLICPVSQIYLLMDRRTEGQFSKMVEIEKDYKLKRTELLLETYKNKEK